MNVFNSVTSPPVLSYHCVLNYFQEPITRSLHTNCILESTLSRIFLFLETPPKRVSAGAFIIANHERAVVLDIRHY